MIKIATLAAFPALALLFSSCGAEAALTHESVTKETASAMTEFVTILERITDEASATAAKAELETLSGQMNELKAHGVQNKPRVGYYIPASKRPTP